MSFTQEKAQQHRNNILAYMVKIMRAKGASEQSIQIASRGLDEYARFAIREIVVTAPDQPEQFQQDPNTVAEALDKEMTEVRKALMQFKRAKAQQRRNEILARMVQMIRARGASERSIQIASKGIDEFAKSVIKPLDAPTPDLPEQFRMDPDTVEDVLGVFLSEVQTQEVLWLWEKRLPLGKITILEGDPGMGKSMLALNLAACVTTGHPMPDGTAGKQGAVILIAPEDGAGDTLRPRLEAAGGDASHVLLLNTVLSLDEKKQQVVDRPFSLSRDLKELEEAIKRTNAVLVVLDPLTAVLGHSIDSSRDQDVREIFTPLAELAERTGCAILIIRHLSKGSSENALYRGAGSIGIIAAARVGLLVAQDPDEENKRILATTKNNLSKQAANLSYQVVENASGIPYIQWLEENNRPLSTLLDGGKNVSIERHKILQVLQDADGPLGPQEVAVLTGQKYTLVRLVLSRMHEAREITRPYRGKYTTLHHPSLLQKGTKTTDTTDTSDKFFPKLMIVR